MSDHSSSPLVKLIGYIREDKANRLERYIDRRPMMFDLDTLKTPAGSNMLHVSLEFGSKLCARYLISNFPELIGQLDSSGRVPLVRALELEPTGKSIGKSVIKKLYRKTLAAGHMTKSVRESYTALRDHWANKKRQGHLLNGSSSSFGGVTNLQQGAQLHDHSNGSDAEFREKLFDCYQDDEWEHFGHQSFATADDQYKGTTHEPFEHWADRIREEFRRKKNEQQNLWRFSNSGTGYRGQQTGTGQSGPRLTAPAPPKLQRHLKIGCEALIAKETEADKELLFQTHLDDIRTIIDSSSPVTYKSFPWPGGSAADLDRIMDVLMSGLDHKNRGAVRDRVRGLLKIWHPDKLMQKIGPHVTTVTDREKLTNSATEVAKRLNAKLVGA